MKIKIFQVVLAVLLYGIQLVVAQCPSSVPLSLSLGPTAASCQANGSIQALVAGGAPPYFYQVTSGPVIAPLQNASIFEALPPGTYTVEVVDSCNQTVSQPVIVYGNYSLPNPVVSVTDVDCPDLGRVEVSVTNGLAPFFYQMILLDTNPPDTIPLQQSSVFEDLDAGEYLVQVFDHCDNFQTRSITIEETVLPDLDAYLYMDSFTSCDEYLLRLQTSPFAVLPITATVIDTSTNTLVFNGALYTTDTFLVVSNTGNYSVDLVDFCDRSFSSYFDIQFPDLMILLGASNFSCDTFVLNLNAGSSLLPISGIIRETSTNTILFNGDIYSADTSITVNGFVGSYTASFTDLCGRFDLDGATIIPSISSTSFQDCALNTISISTTFFLPPISYQILVGPEIRPPQSTNYFSDLPSGTYTVEVSDTCGNVETQTITTEDYNWDIFFYFLDDGECKPDTVDMGYFLLGAPTLPVTIELLSTPSGPVDTIVLTPGDYQDLPIGLYSFLVTDGCGDVITAAIELAEPYFSPTLNSTTTPTTNCLLGDLLITGTYSNNIDGAVQLELLDGTIIAYFQSPIATSFLNLPQQDYVLRFSPDTANCLSVETLDTISIAPYVQPGFEIIHTIGCSDGTAVLSCVAQNGVAPYTYEIISGPVLAQVQSSSIFENLPFGTYDVRVVDACFNSFVNSVSIEEFVVHLQGESVWCVDDTLQLAVQQINGMTYSWTGPNGFTSSAAEFTIEGVKDVNAGSYTVVLEFANCLLDTSSIDIVVNPCASPINLLGFNARLDGRNTVDLNWELTHDGELSGIALERSFDGIDFEEIYLVSEELWRNEYTYVDTPLKDGHIYYRLLLLDIDGSVISSPTQVVHFEAIRATSVFPSLVTYHTSLTVASERFIEEVLIYNQTGVLMSSTLFLPSDGQVVFEVDVSDVDSGMYFVRARMGGGDFETSSIVVLRD